MTNCIIITLIKKIIKAHVSYSENITMKIIIFEKVVVPTWHLSDPFVLKNVRRGIGKRGFRHAKNVRKLSADRYMCEFLEKKFNKQVNCRYLDIL